MLDPEGKTIGTFADIWMLGCIAYILAFGRQPFSGDKDQIIKGRLKYPVEGELTDLIRSMLSLEIENRPTAGKVLEKLRQKMGSNESTES